MSAFLSILVILIGAALLFWVDFLISREFYRAAQAKGFNERKYFWLPFWLGIVGYLLVIALPSGNPDFFSDDITEDL